MTPDSPPFSGRRLAILAVAAPSLLLAACTSADLGMDGSTVLTAAMTGAAEAPGPGDPDGSGSATIRIDPLAAGRVCYDLSVTGVAPATAAHIHRGGLGVAGPVVVTLTAPTAGSSSGCVDAAASLGAEILAMPAAFYVNVHNAPYPNGAVRGQLVN
ncbi:CHRD domain-containing protein [Brevundimonas sp.]|uniref:CHRD domain-containing protein n=1 Tax=Brevundimonas sp. TaxID=1871086 RepID=UPI002D51B874|nr:CHRD domain-containing protein [Brevundimonas sp.]HYC97755.1 CHRD domain-containing protein [Brevundimonas sp.]